MEKESISLFLSFNDCTGKIWLFLFWIHSGMCIQTHAHMPFATVLHFKYIKLALLGISCCLSVLHYTLSPCGLHYIPRFGGPVQSKDVTGPYPLQNLFSLIPQTKLCIISFWKYCRLDSRRDERKQKHAAFQSSLPYHCTPCSLSSFHLLRVSCHFFLMVLF